MRAVLVVVCLLLTLALLDASSGNKRKNGRLGARPSYPKKSKKIGKRSQIWRGPGPRPIRRPRHRPGRRPRPMPRPRQRPSIWSSIKRNAADMKKLTKAINETQRFQQEFGPVVDTLKENMDDMKEGFASMTLMMAQMKTSIANLQKVIGTESEAGSGSPPGIRTSVVILITDLVPPSQLRQSVSQNLSQNLQSRVWQQWQDL